MNTIQISGFLKEKNLFLKEQGVPKLNGKLNVGHERGYDEIDFMIRGHKALKFDSIVHTNDEVIIIGKLEKKRGKLYIKVENIKVVKN